MLTGAPNALRIRSLAPIAFTHLIGDVHITALNLVSGRINRLLVCGKY